MNDKDAGKQQLEEVDPAALRRARDLIGAKRAKAAGRRSVGPSALIVGLSLVALAIGYFFDDSPSAVDSRARSEPVACGVDDSQCHGQRIIAQIQAPCSAALEAKLQRPPTWDDSAFERRFSQPAWYGPSRTLIFYGRRAVVTNALGMTQQPAYFCVVTTTGAVVKADFPDLD